MLVQCAVAALATCCLLLACHTMHPLACHIRGADELGEVEMQNTSFLVPAHIPTTRFRGPDVGGHQPCHCMLPIPVPTVQCTESHITGGGADELGQVEMQATSFLARPIAGRFGA